MYNLNLQSILHQYGRQNFDLESRNLTVRESSQANMKMMRKSIGIYFVQRDLGVWELVPRKFFKLLSLEREKIPPLRGRKICYMIDLHSEMKHIILPSNQCRTNLKNSKV